MEPFDKDWQELSSRELDAMLAEWKVPEPPTRLRLAVFPEQVECWWRRLWNTSVRVPAPVVCCLAVFLAVGVWRSVVPGAGRVVVKTERVEVPVGAADGIRREMVDRSTGSYFGYDLVVGPGDEKNGYLITFRSLPEIHRIGQGTALKLLPIPKYPPPMIVHDSDTIALDLMASPDGKQKLTDYIEIFSHEPEPKAATTTADPRDFTLDDGPVRFDAERITVWTNGQKYSGLFGFTGKDGATFWIAFPGQGRYILSLARHDGFNLSGTVRDNVASFRDGGQEYELRFLSPIAGAEKAWRLYTMHDPTYRRLPNQQNMISMGTGRLENLLPQ